MRRSLFAAAIATLAVILGGATATPASAATETIVAANGNLDIAGDDIDEYFEVGVLDPTRWLVRLRLGLGQGSDLTLVGCTLDNFGFGRTRTMRCVRDGAHGVTARLGGGADVLLGSDLFEEAVVLPDPLDADGQAGNDILEGGRANDVLRGSAGNDLLRRRRAPRRWFRRHAVRRLGERHAHRRAR